MSYVSRYIFVSACMIIVSWIVVVVSSLYLWYQYNAMLPMIQCWKPVKVNDGILLSLHHNEIALKCRALARAYANEHVRIFN